MTDAADSRAMLINPPALARQARLSAEELDAFLDDWNVCVLTGGTVLELCVTTLREFQRRFTSSEDGPQAPLTRAWLFQHSFLCELLAHQLTHQANSREVR